MNASERRLGRDNVVQLVTGEESVWIRYVIDAEGLFRMVEISVHHQPPTWIESSWSYAQGNFEARVISGHELAAWITGEGNVGTLPAVDFLELFEFPLPYERRPSGAEGRSETLEWPTDEWRGAPKGAFNAIPGELVPGIGPLFRSFDLAVANLIGLAGHPGWQPPPPEFVVRRQDRSARIATAHVGREAIDVTVEGVGLEGATLELAGEVPGPTHELGPETSQTFHFDRPPPGQFAWLALHRDGELLDTRRRLERELHGTAEMGVTFEPEPDLTEDSPFTLEEQAQIRTALAAIRVQVQIEFGGDDDAGRVTEILDRAEAASEHEGRVSWRERFYGALVDAGVRGVVTWEHVTFVFNLVRAGVRAMTGLELPELPR